MKRGTTAAGTLLIFAAAIGAEWWLSRRNTNQPVLKLSGVTAPVLPVSKIIQPNARTPYLGLEDPRWKEYQVKRNTDHQFEWKTPIEFFGKVVDDHELPVAGAAVEFQWNGTRERYGGDGVQNGTSESDVNGLFAISGIEGKGLTVRVHKDGFYANKMGNNGNFEYAGFWEPHFIEPDRNLPVIFRLVKRPIAEPTYRISGRLLLPPPVWIAHLDLLRKPTETTDAGDMTVRIERPPNPGYKNPYDWDLKIEGNGGAEFAETSEEFMLRAPDGGYQNKIEKHFHVDRGEPIVTIRFYVRNKTRKFYAGIDLEVTPYYPMINVDKACIIVTGTVNPNDSPNVDYDPAKDHQEE